MMIHMIKTVLIAAMLSAPLLCRGQLTLDECLDKAVGNYPLIRQYGLTERTLDLQLSDINKSWLPRISVYGQGTAQNNVPEFPETLRHMIEQAGADMKGLGHVQYKAGAEISQTIWDGGASQAQRAVERASAAEKAAATDVGLYSIRERVMNLFFGILLMEQQIAQTENTMRLLEADHRLIESMCKNGTATRSDADMTEALILVMRQSLTEAGSAMKSYRDMLGIFMGENIDGKTLTAPEAEMPVKTDPARPELALYDARINLNKAKDAASASSLRPRVGMFAQAFYGYPGFNNFEAMVRRDLSWNMLAGVKIQWNIDAFYTRRNTREKLATASAGVENEREVFLFNNRLEASSQSEAINSLRKVIEDDSRITALRKNVRLAAESQLKNGVIDATALLTKITDENQAELTARYHEIQLLQKIYQLKNILNQ